MVKSLGTLDDTDRKFNELPDRSLEDKKIERRRFGKITSTVMDSANNLSCESRPSLERVGSNPSDEDKKTNFRKPAQEKQIEKLHEKSKSQA